MKQTSIEWLISKLPMVNENDPYLSEIIQQAKEMHKQEIIEAFLDDLTPSKKILIKPKSTIATM